MKKWIFLVILVVAFLFRIVGLSNYPVGFTPDEASFGYDAYSILKTGKDQWGKPFPLVLESFGDYKSPLYTYITIPSVFIFGLNKFAVRLPNALLGSLAVLVVYLLTKKLFGREKVALWSSLLLAISPWHIMMSRGAFEANLTTFFLPLGVLLFLKKKYVLSSIVFGLNLFTYHSAKFVTPLIVISLLFFYWDEVKKPSKDLLIAGLIFVFSIILTAYTMFVGAGARVAERSIAQGAGEEASSYRLNSSKAIPGPLARLTHNKYTVTIDRFLNNYVTYLSPQFLFASGPNEGTYGMIPGRGVYFWFVIPFFLFVKKIFFEQKENRKQLLFLFSWMLLSIIPASLATGAGYSANRATIMMPSIEIALGLGAVYLFEFLKRRRILMIGFSLLVVLSFAFFLEDYFVQSKYKIAKSMLYGNLEAAEWVRDNVGERRIIVDKSLSEPHIYFAFAYKIDPKVYQDDSKNWDYKAVGVNWVDQLPEYSLGMFTFRNTENEKLLLSNTVLVGRQDRKFPEEIVSTKVIGYPDNTPSVYIDIVDLEKNYAEVN